MPEARTELSLGWLLRQPWLTPGLTALLWLLPAVIYEGGTSHGAIPLEVYARALWRAVLLGEIVLWAGFSAWWLLGQVGWIHLAACLAQISMGLIGFLVGLEIFIFLRVTFVGPSAILMAGLFLLYPTTNILQTRTLRRLTQGDVGRRSFFVGCLIPVVLTILIVAASFIFFVRQDTADFINLFMMLGLVWAGFWLLFAVVQDVACSPYLRVRELPLERAELRGLIRRFGVEGLRRVPSWEEIEAVPIPRRAGRAEHLERILADCCSPEEYYRLQARMGENLFEPEK